MKIISGKAEAKQLMQQALDVFDEMNQSKFIDAVQLNVLQKKIKFPALEAAALHLCNSTDEKNHIAIAQQIMDKNEIGSHVIAGIILQKKLNTDFDLALQKACDYMIQANVWYSCDIIGERVMGMALLHQPEKTIPVLHQYSFHKNKWIVRVIGVAAHYAVKKGLAKKYVEVVFKLLLLNATVTDFHTKKGIGWAAKTISKFYPELIEKYEADIYENADVKQWFTSKIKIGLSRKDKYAQKYNR